MNVDNSLVSQTLPESVQNEVHSGSSGLSNVQKFLVSKETFLSNVSNLLPAKRGFKMACWNINSLIKHVDELRVLLAEFSIDILQINDTKLEESVKSSELYVSGYEFIHRDRNINGGWVAFL